MNISILQVISSNYDLNLIEIIFSFQMTDISFFFASTASRKL